MIDRAVGAVAQRLNDFLRVRFGVADDLATATPLVDLEGKPVAAARNQLTIFVTNITHDTMPRSGFSRNEPTRDHGASGRAPVRSAPINLNVYLMLASNFDPKNYLESLKILSSAIQFFQANPVLDHANAPDLDPGLRQLSFEIHNQDTETLSQLWGTLGGRYAPSIQYKMRTVVIDSGALVDEALVILSPTGEARPRAAEGTG